MFSPAKQQRRLTVSNIIPSKADADTLSNPALVPGSPEMSPEQKRGNAPSPSMGGGAGCVRAIVGTKSHAGKDPYHHKENQDSFCVVERFRGDPGQMFFGCFDGHGINGKHVSSFVKERVPAILADSTEVRADPMKALKKSYLKANEQMKRSNIDCTLSGSTGVCTYIRGPELYCANVGDSRAVLGRQDGNHIKAFDLSSDHKPDRDDEKKRILKMKGRVHPIMDGDEFIGPCRVWLSNRDLPGLACSRAFGDTIAGTVGVIAEPEILRKNLDTKDKFIILASDGVWEFITSQEAVDMVSKFNDPQRAAEALYVESDRRWREEDEDGAIDDITAVVVFLQVP